LDRVPRATVRRADLDVVLRAGGLVECPSRTVIRCEVENMKRRHAASTIIALAPEGSLVRKGEVVCRLDASEYEELLRVQFIRVAAAGAEKRCAELDLDAATTALAEYRDGRSGLDRQGLQGRIALAEAQMAQLSDRVRWSSQMLTLGYLSRARFSAENSALERAEFALSQARSELRHLEDFEFPTRIRVLESRVKSATLNLGREALRLQSQQERLDHLKHQVALCTIRAPHDGFLIFAHKPKRDVRIDEGIWVRQKQELFYLPDLSKLAVAVWLHETMVARASPGMRARVRLEGSADLLEGGLVAIDPLPVDDRSKYSSGEVKNFVGWIQLDTKVRNPRPGMTAEVEITTTTLQGALLIPVEAPRREQGRDVCYVLGPNGCQRRTVTLGQATHEWLQVIEGIREGEEVVLAGKLPQSLIHDL
jgi:HlyD family secretion protein